MIRYMPTDDRQNILTATENEILRTRTYMLYEVTAQCELRVL